MQSCFSERIGWRLGFCLGLMALVAAAYGLAPLMADRPRAGTPGNVDYYFTADIPGLDADLLSRIYLDNAGEQAYAGQPRDGKNP